MLHHLRSQLGWLCWVGSIRLGVGIRKLGLLVVCVLVEVGEVTGLVAAGVEVTGLAAEGVEGTGLVAAGGGGVCILMAV